MDRLFLLFTRAHQLAGWASVPLLTDGLALAFADQSLVVEYDYLLPPDLNKPFGLEVAQNRSGGLARHPDQAGQILVREGQADRTTRAVVFAVGFGEFLKDV